MILLLKSLCMKLCLIITSVTIHTLFKCILLPYFISYQEQHSKQLSQYSYQSRQNSDLWRTELPYTFLLITENKNYTFKITRCICSALLIARNFFCCNILLHSFFSPLLKMNSWNSSFFFCLINWTFFSNRARIHGQKSLKCQLYWKKYSLTYVSETSRFNKLWHYSMKNCKFHQGKVTWESFISYSFSSVVI